VPRRGLTQGRPHSRSGFFPRAIWTLWLAPHALTSLGRRLICRQAVVAHFYLQDFFTPHALSTNPTRDRQARRRPAFLKVVRARSGRCDSHHTPSRAWVDGSSVGKGQQRTFISKTFSAHTPSQPHPGPQARRRPAFLKVVRARSGRCGSHHMSSRAWVDGSSVGKGQQRTFLSKTFPAHTPSQPHV
jgi:hypothetical protein